MIIWNLEEKPVPSLSDQLNVILYVKFTERVNSAIFSGNSHNQHPILPADLLTIWDRNPWFRLLLSKIPLAILQKLKAC